MIGRSQCARLGEVSVKALAVRLVSQSRSREKLARAAPTSVSAG
jgi:hypothetical protein